jgi:transcription elongation GreA/GreB family factor
LTIPLGSASFHSDADFVWFEIIDCIRVYYTVTKEQLIQEIIMALSADLSVFSSASKASHEAATHAECLPDNKYDTTALEASYIAQGQANRAQEIRVALESYRVLSLQAFDDNMPIRLTALVTLEDENGNLRRLFLGPQAGGMKIADVDGEIVVITPGSPLGRRLLGLRNGDDVPANDDVTALPFTIVSVC